MAVEECGEPLETRSTPSPGFGRPSSSRRAFSMRGSGPSAVAKRVATSFPSIIVHDPKLSGRRTDAGISHTVFLPSDIDRGSIENVSVPSECIALMTSSA